MDKPRYLNTNLASFKIVTFNANTYNYASSH
jgi:hypothetical protein